MGGWLGEGGWVRVTGQVRQGESGGAWARRGVGAAGTDLGLHVGGGVWVA